MRRIVIAALAGALWAPHAAAQFDPGASRAENQVNSINRSMLNRQQERAASQQNQFEINSLRNEAARQPQTPVAPWSPITPR